MAAPTESGLVKALGSILTIAASGLLAWMAFNVADTKEKVGILQSELRRAQYDITEINRRIGQRPPF